MSCPGSAHVAHQGCPPHQSAKLVMCRQRCVHPVPLTRQPLKNPIQGKYYDGRSASMRHESRRFLEVRRTQAGRAVVYPFADGTAHRTAMQGNDFVQILMYTRGSLLQLPRRSRHGKRRGAMEAGEEIASTAMGRTPPTPTRPEHRGTHHHKPAAPQRCIACHMPKIEQTIAM